MAVAVEIRIFDQSNELLDVVEPDLESAVWRLNKPGMMKFWLAWDDPKCLKDNLKPGNRVLARFDNGLPDWGGVIDLPRKRRIGSVGCTAYSGEKLLDFRVTAKSRSFSADPPGVIFQALIEEENTEYTTGITIGEIYSGGTGRSTTYHYHDLLARVQDLVRLSGQDFAILPEYTEGSPLVFKAHWYQRRGTDKRDEVWLLEGANCSRPELDEQGMLANCVITIGEGSTWGDERLTGIAQDTASRDEYGYREYSEQQSGVKYQETLDENANEILAVRAYPRNRVSLRVVNQEPALFADYGVGDIVKAVLFVDSEEWYFESPVRVIGREWTPSGGCKLEVEEWFQS